MARVKHKHPIEIDEALQTMSNHNNCPILKIFPDDALNRGIRGGINTFVPPTVNNSFSTGKEEQNLNVI